MENLPPAPPLLSNPTLVSNIIAGSNITIDPTSGIGSVIINAPGSGPGGGVLTLAGLEGAITLSSPDNSITITPDAQDIALTIGGSVVTSVAAGTGIDVSATTGDVTISNTGVTTISDGTRSSAAGITLTAGTGMSVVNSAGTFTIANTGVTELTGGDGIGISAQTGSVTVSNLGVVSLVAGEYINVTEGEGHAWSIDNTGVQTFNTYTGAVTISGGTGIELGGTEPNIEIQNSGVTEAVAGDGISVSGGSGSVTIGNTGVISIADITGVVTLSATGLTITPSGQNLDFNVTAGAVSSVNSQTGAVLIEAGTGITVNNTETPSIEIVNNRPGPVASGTIDQTGFTLQTTGLATGQYYKAVTVSGMTTNGLVLATANGTPAVCSVAWITTVIPTTDTITIWLAGDPVVATETWEAHYVVTSF